MKLDLAYFGAPDFSAFFLEKLLTDTLLRKVIKIKLVVTQPDKPAGRKQILTPSPVKIAAQRYKIPVYSKSKILNSKEIDLALLYAYAVKIPKQLLELPKFGFWNIHPSLLPKYRGPSPVVYPLILGEKKTGATIIKMDDKIDHGPIIGQQQLAILPKEKRDALTIRLTNLAFEIFKKAILSKPIKQLNNEAIKQDNKKATYTRLIKKDYGYIPLLILKKAIRNQPLTPKELPIVVKNYFKKNSTRLRNLKLEIRNSSKIIFDYFRGLHPWPGIWTLVPVGSTKKQPNQNRLNGSQPNLKRLKITGTDLIRNRLKIKTVQLEGKKKVSFKTFNRAYKIF